MNAPINQCFVHAEDWQQIAFFPASQQALVKAGLDVDTPSFTSDLHGLGLSIDQLESLLRPHLNQADQLLTGYTNDQQTVEDGFAFYDPDLGAFYGRLEGEFVTELYFDNQFCDCGVDFSAAFNAVETIAQQHGLMLVDCLLGLISDLRQPGSFQAYFDEM